MPRYQGQTQPCFHEFFSAVWHPKKKTPPLLSHNDIPGLNELTDTRHSRMAGIRTVIPQQYNKSSDDAQVLGRPNSLASARAVPPPLLPSSPHHGIEIPVPWLDKWVPSDQKCLQKYLSSTSMAVSLTSHQKNSCFLFQGINISKL